MYLLTFDEFHQVAKNDGRKFIDCILFYGAFIKIAGGQPC